MFRVPSSGALGVEMGRVWRAQLHSLMRYAQNPAKAVTPNKGNTPSNIMNTCNIGVKDDARLRTHMRIHSVARAMWQSLQAL